MSRRPLTWLLVAEAISLTGSRITFVAVPWLVLVTTGSAVRTGVVAFAEMLPYVLANALGGPVVDRRGPRPISVAADGTSAATTALIPLLYGAGALPMGALIAAVAVSGTIRGIGDISKSALFPAAVDESGVDLTRATSLHDGIGRLSFLLGGALGGILIAWLGPANVLFVDAASFLTAAFLIRWAVPRRATSTVTPIEPYRAALSAGARYVARDPLLRAIVLVVLATNLLDQAYLAVVVPVWVHDVLGSPAALGVMLGAFGAGAVMGNVAFTVLAPRLPKFTSFAVGYLISGGPPILVLALTDSLVVVTLTTFVSGLFCAAVNPVLGATVYGRVPAELRARVLGLLKATAWAGIPVGGLAGGLLVEAVGLTAAIVTLGSIYLAVTVVPFVAPVWRDMDQAAVTSQSTLVSP